MEQIIPFKKNISFDRKIESITSLTLEHDYSVSRSLVEGTFLVNGTYRNTEASLIDEDFFYKLPFEISLSDRIKIETINLKIEDFNYELKDNEELELKINLNLICEEKEDREEEVLPLKDETLDMEKEFEETLKQNEEDNVLDDILEKELEESPCERKDFVTISPKESSNEDVSMDLFSSNLNTKKEYVLYKVYIAHEEDTITSISTKFNVPINILEEYNEMKEITKGDKIIIPYVFE